MSKLTTVNTPPRIAFLGTPEFAAIILKTISLQSIADIKVVITQPDRPAGRGKQLAMSPVKQFALEEKIPILQPLSIKKQGESFLDELSKTGPYDGALVVAFGQILPVWLLDYFDGKCVNVHPSLLPRWRGATPVPQAIVAGDTETGVCLMKMEAGLDTGPVYSVVKTPILTTDTSETLFQRVPELSVGLLSKDLADIFSGKVEGIPQDDSKATHSGKILKADAKVDWTKSATEIVNRCRGLWPFPGAYTEIYGKRLKIAFAEADDSANTVSQFGGTPGEIVYTDGQTCKIASGYGTVSLKKIKPEGKRLMDIDEFIRGNKLEKGMRLL